MNRRKLDAKAQHLTFIGYEDHTKGYRLLNTATNKIIISRDVVFIEDSKLEISFDKVVENASIISEEMTDCVSTKNSTENESENESNDEWSIAETEEITVRRSERNKNKDPKQYVCKATSEDAEEPATYEEAIHGQNHDEWISAMDDEYHSLNENKTWTLETRNEYG